MAQEIIAKGTGSDTQGNSPEDFEDHKKRIERKMKFPKGLLEKLANASVPISLSVQSSTDEPAETSKG